MRIWWSTCAVALVGLLPCHALIWTTRCERFGRMMLRKKGSAVPLRVVNVPETHGQTDASPSSWIRILEDEKIDISTICDHESTGEALGEFITGWMDARFGMDHVHKRMGDRVSEEYCRLRQDQHESELARVSLLLGETMEKEFSFEGEEDDRNPWDVSFAVYDALLHILHSQNGSIATPVSSPQLLTFGAHKRPQTLNVTISNDQLLKVVNQYHSMLERFKVIRDFFQGEVSWDTMLVFVAIALGFREDVATGIVSQRPDLAPFRWKDLTLPPNILLDDECIARMNDELPSSDLVADSEQEAKSALEKETAPADVGLDAVLGTEVYQEIKASTNPIIQRQLTLCRWLFATGLLLDPNFPPDEPVRIARPDDALFEGDNAEDDAQPSTKFYRLFCDLKIDRLQTMSRRNSRS